jgi:hypothetical protein
MLLFSELDIYALLFLYSICFHNRQITHFTEHGELCCCQLISRSMANYVVVSFCQIVSYVSACLAWENWYRVTLWWYKCGKRSIVLILTLYILFKNKNKTEMSEHGELCCFQLISRSMANYVVVSFCQIVSYVSTCSWPDIMVSS